MGDKGYFSKVCLCSFTSALTLLLQCSVALLLLVQGGHLSHRKFYILHLGRREVVALPAFAVSQVSSAQSNTSAKVAYSDSLQSK